MELSTIQHDIGDQASASLARPLAPEDICPGQHVAVLRVTYEVPSFVWDCCDSFGDRSELVRLSMLPDHTGEPLKVKAVCLPFVWGRTSSGQEGALDIRRVQLARVDEPYARAARKAAKARQRREKPKSKRKRK